MEQEKLYVIFPVYLFLEESYYTLLEPIPTGVTVVLPKQAIQDGKLIHE